MKVKLFSFIKGQSTPPTDVTPDPTPQWADFTGQSTDEAITGINTAITLEVSAVNVSGTPTLEYRKNGGAWVAFTTAVPGSVSISNGDTLGFRASGPGSESATITVTNTSDSNTVLDTVLATSPIVTDVTPDPISWGGTFDNESTDETFTGIDTAITIEVSAVNTSGTPTLEYRKNSGAWVAFTVGAPASVSISSGDTLGFRVSGTNTDAASITVTNTSDGDAVLDTVTGTVVVALPFVWSNTLKAASIALSQTTDANDTATTSDDFQSYVYANLQPAADGTYGSVGAKFYTEFTITNFNSGAGDSDIKLGFNVFSPLIAEYEAPEVYTPSNERADTSFTLKWHATRQLVYQDSIVGPTVIGTTSGTTSVGDKIGMAIDTENELVTIYENTGSTWFNLGTIDYGAAKGVGQDFTGQDVYASAYIATFEVGPTTIHAIVEKPDTHEQTIVGYTPI
jgi:hypothetical protein